MQVSVSSMMFASLFFQMVLLTDNNSIELVDKKISLVLLEISQKTPEIVEATVILLNASKKTYIDPHLEYHTTERTMHAQGKKIKGVQHTILLTIPTQPTFRATYTISQSLENFLKLYFNKSDELANSKLPLLLDWLKENSTSQDYNTFERDIKYEHCSPTVNTKELAGDISLEYRPEHNNVKNSCSRLKCNFYEGKLKPYSFITTNRDIIFQDLSESVIKMYLVVEYSFSLSGKSMGRINDLTRYFEERIKVDTTTSVSTTGMFKQLLIIESIKVATFFLTTLVLIYFLFFKKNRSYPGYKLEKMKQRLKNKLAKTV
eukprot:GAHX01001055.1.p1 GENE.GAHX01001055.1~~GAHX01001055.1.p1  ORF type:complete len:327 (+),score=44.00 GAHX01001055.1:30-983(+)